ncbi:hypothetical protein A2U01_0104656, partial [Trifolium medium]|nr:hypothetical protein [Trifolium medium]
MKKLGRDTIRGSE